MENDMIIDKERDPHTFRCEMCGERFFLATRVAEHIKECHSNSIVQIEKLLNHSPSDANILNTGITTKNALTKIKSGTGLVRHQRFKNKSNFDFSYWKRKNSLPNKSRGNITRAPNTRLPMKRKSSKSVRDISSVSVCTLKNGMEEEIFNTESLQPFVRLERMSSHLYAECVSKGFVTIQAKGNCADIRPITSQSNVSVVPIIADLMKKIKESVLKGSALTTGSNLKIIVPIKMLNQIQKISELNKLSSPTNLPGIRNTIPQSAKIVRYGVEDLMRDDLKRKAEKEEITKKEKLLKKMLEKYHEKETKKVVIYYQKMLSRYVLKNQQHLIEFEDILLNARNFVKRSEIGIKLLEELKCVPHVRCRNSVRRILKKLIQAIKEVPVKEKKQEKGNKLIFQDSGLKKKFKCELNNEQVFEGFRNFSTSTFGNKKNSFKASPRHLKQGKGKIGLRKFPQSANKSSKLSKKSSRMISSLDVGAKQAGFILECSHKVGEDISSTAEESNLCTTDPFADSSIVTNDKQLIQCLCGKLNCYGLHPEMFF